MTLPLASEGQAASHFHYPFQSHLPIGKLRIDLRAAIVTCVALPLVTLIGCNLVKTMAGSAILVQALVLSSWLLIGTTIVFVVAKGLPIPPHVMRR